MSGPDETRHPGLGDIGQNFEVTVVTPPFLELWMMVSPVLPYPLALNKVFLENEGDGVDKMTLFFSSSHVECVSLATVESGLWGQLKSCLFYLLSGCLGEETCSPMF